MSEKCPPRVGLVLSGGGAKGAYQVGVLKALLDLGASIDLVAGASMGALNGAVLACAPSLAEGVTRLETLWNTLAERSPITANVPSYLKLLSAVGLTLGNPLAGVFANMPALTRGIYKVLPALNVGGNWLETALLSDRPLKELMNKYLDSNALSNGLPLYVSVYKSQGGLADVLGCMVAEAGLIDTPPSEFLHIQSLPIKERKNALLASVAIPLLYPVCQLGDSRYTDGGQGGWQTAQGNTPITPLIEAGCQKIIVTHLTNGSLWDRHDFPNTSILEIRPQFPLTLDDSLQSTVKATLGFDESNITKLMDQGCRDTQHCVGRVMRALQHRQVLRQSEHALNECLLDGNAADAALTHVMSRLQ